MLARVIETEPLTKDTVSMLQKVAGFGAMIMKWDIDYSVGAGIIDNCTKCIWTEDGLRTTISYSNGTGVISQSKEPDPEYFRLKCGEEDGETTKDTPAKD